MVTTIRLHLYQKNNKRRGSSLRAAPRLFIWNDIPKTIKSSIFVP